MISEYDLRFAISTQPSGRVEIRYFRNPQHAGETFKLTPKEREEFAYVLAAPGFHAIARDEGDLRQLALDFDGAGGRKQEALAA